MGKRELPTRALELKKHVSAIHCANSLTLVQRKIANALLYHAYDDLQEAEEHEISIRTLTELIGYESHDYKLIKKALVDLISTVIEWNILSEDSVNREEEWNASSIISSARIKGSTCYYSYSAAMKKLLYMPIMYGRLNMAVQSLFKSNYGLALYENCVRYQNLPFTPWFELEMFRKLMGVADSKYTVFRDLKRRVIEKAVSEVNEYTSLQIEPEFKREKRAVVAIRFALSVANKEIAEEPMDFGERELSSRLREDFGINADSQSKLMDAYNENYILEKMELIEQSPSFRDGKIKNLSSYLMAALEKDFQPPKDSKRRVAKKRTVDEQQDKEIRDAEIAEHRRNREYQDYVTEFITNNVENLAQENKADVLAEFQHYLSQQQNGFVLKNFKRHGINHPVVTFEFCVFLAEFHPTLREGLLSYDEFLDEAQA